VISIAEPTVLDILQRLIKRKLVVEVNQAGAQVPRYERRMRVKWLLE